MAQPALYFLEGYGADQKLKFYGLTLYKAMNWTTKNVADAGGITKQNTAIPLTDIDKGWEGADTKTWLPKSKICSLFPVRSCPHLFPACGLHFPCKYIDTDVTLNSLYCSRT